MGGGGIVTVNNGEVESVRVLIGAVVSGDVMTGGGVIIGEVPSVIHI